MRNMEGLSAVSAGGVHDLKIDVSHAGVLLWMGNRAKSEPLTIPRSALRIPQFWATAMPNGPDSA
jgi:hypothetical protein